MGREALPAILEVALERKYLDTALAERVAADARRAGKPAEAVLVEKGILSTRRIERLQVHVRYKSLRKVDKAYGKVGVKAGLLTEEQVKAGLDLQRRRFEEKRDCLRLGAILVKQGHITLEQDKQIRTKVAKLSSSTASESASAAATLLDDSASQPSDALPVSSVGPVPTQPTYEAIDDAVARVDAVRKLQDDLSESANDSSADEPALRDSAAEFESALNLLARRRVSPPEKRVVSKSGSIHKSGGLRITA